MQIHWAAKRGDNSAIERQLQRGVSVDALDREGKTPLMWAVEFGKAGLSTLRLLIANEADVNAVSTQFQKTPLSLAASYGQPDIVRFLLDAGANPCFVDRFGCNAVGSAISEDPGHLEIIETLLQAGASPDVSDHDDTGPLFFAMRYGNFQAARLLLKYGARREQVELSPLSWTVALGTVDELIAELLRLGESAANECAEQGPWLMAMLTGDIAKAELLLRHGANLETRGSRGRTSLMFAVSCDQTEMTQWLLEHGADPLAQDEWGQTALMEAVAYQAAGCVRVLVRAGVPLENPDRQHAIAFARAIDVVRALVEAGADIDAVGDWDAGIPDGHWPLCSAAEMGDLQFVRQLLELGANPRRDSIGETALHKAVDNDHLEIVSLLLEQGADPNASDYDMSTPAMTARSVECLDLLLVAGADVDAFDCVGADVIQHHRDPEMLDRLVAAGATLDSPPEALGSLLNSASKEGDLRLIKYLLKHRVDVNQQKILEQTPLIAAAENGHPEIVRRLLDAGADPNIRDLFGRTALFYAAASEASLAFQLKQEFSIEATRAKEPRQNKLILF